MSYQRVVEYREPHYLPVHSKKKVLQEDEKCFTRPKPAESAEGAG